MVSSYTSSEAREKLQVSQSTLSTLAKCGKIRKFRHGIYCAEDVDTVYRQKNFSSLPLNYSYLDHLGNRLTLLHRMPHQWKNAYRSLWREAMLAICNEILKECKHPRPHAHIYLTLPEIRIALLRLAQGEHAAQLARQYEISESTLSRWKHQSRRQGRI